jgi:sugar/nucleoside kinase (ribokinase family)
MSILVYGSLVPDIVFTVPRLPTAGEDIPAGSMRVVAAAGGGGNVAVALAGWGYDVMAGGNSVGDDPLGRWSADEFTSRGISLPNGYVEPGGVTAANGIIVTPDGERTILGSDYSAVTWLPVTDWKGIDAAMVDRYSGDAGTAVIAAAADRSIPVVGTDRTGAATKGLSMLLWSAEEHPNESEAVAVAATGPLVVVTDGPRPVTVYGAGGTTHRFTPEPHTVADSTGAGDLFAAAVTAGLSDGIGLEATIQRALDVATRYVAAGSRLQIPPLTSMGS